MYIAARPASHGFALWGALCSLVFALAPSAAAQSPPTRPSIADVLAYAHVHNADIRIARLQTDSAAGEQRIARAIPNPSFAITPANPTQYTLTEPLDIGPARVYRTRAAGQGSTAVHADAANVERQVVFTVRQSFLDLLLAESVREVALVQDTIVRRLLSSDSVRYAEGDLAQRDLNTTELQYAHAESNLARATAAARTARITLQVVMGVTRPDTTFRVTGTLDYRPIDLDLDSLHALAQRDRPDLASADERVEQSQSLSSLAAAQLIPMPGIAGVYQSQPFGSGRYYALGLSLNLPVFYWFGGERQRAAAGLASAREAQQRTSAAVSADVDGAVNDFVAARTLASRYAGGLLAKARETVEMQRFAYEHGNASVLDLLNAISTFGDTQTDYYTAVHDYLVAAYAVDRAVGRDLIP